MDKFPEDFNRVKINEVITLKQSELLRNSRKQIYETLIDEVNKYEQQITIKLHKLLWYEHKVKIIREILDKFGKIKIKSDNSQCSVSKTIESDDDIPPNVCEITIDFVYKN